jgi:hypothetical protein
MNGLMNGHWMNPTSRMNAPAQRLDGGAPVPLRMGGGEVWP